MKKIIIIIFIVLGLCGIIFARDIIDWLFSEQYNENGISHFLVITIDKEQDKEYLGELDNHKIYIEGLNINETNFRNIDAENVSIKEAIDNELVSINEWKKYAWKINKIDDKEILKFENYQIVCDNEECVIKP